MKGIKSGFQVDAGSREIFREQGILRAKIMKAIAEAVGPANADRVATDPKYRNLIIHFTEETLDHPRLRNELVEKIFARFSSFQPTMLKTNSGLRVTTIDVSNPITLRSESLKRYSPLITGSTKIEYIDARTAASRGRPTSAFRTGATQLKTVCVNA